MKIPSRTTLLLLLATVAFASAGLAVNHYLVPASKQSYITAPVTRADLKERVLASGTLQAFKTVDVGAQVSGQLKKLHVRLGDQVRAGRLLAEIDPVLQQNALKDAAATRENVEAQIRAKKALLKQYELAYRRQLELSSQDAASKADLEGAQAQLESTRADLAALFAQLKKAEISVDTARANLDYTRIVAPMDGIVIAIVTEEGQTVVSAQSAPTILKLANLDTITVKAQISEADIIRVKPQQTAYFTILGEPDQRYYSKLRAIEPAPDSITTGSTSSSTSSTTAIYYNGLFDVPNPGNKLRVSMTAQVSIVLSEVKHALCIPVSALADKEKDGRSRVKVLQNGQSVERTIRTGITDNVQVQVLDGLQEGEMVIIGDSSSLPTVEKSSPGPPPPRG